jgi:hypothetical protein
MTDEHPDPSGPEEPETPVRATDGEPHLRSVPGGGSAVERADEADTVDPETDPQLNFFTAAGKFNLGAVIKAKIPVEYRLKLEGKSIPAIKGGLIDPYGPPVPIFGSFIVAHYKPVFIRDEDHKVEGVIVYLSLKPTIAQSVESEAGQVLLAEALKGTRIFPVLRDTIDAAPTAETG